MEQFPFLPSFNFHSSLPPSLYKNNYLSDAGGESMADDMGDNSLPFTHVFIFMEVLLWGWARLIFWFFDKCLRTLLADLMRDFGRQISKNDNPFSSLGDFKYADLSTGASIRLVEFVNVDLIDGPLRIRVEDCELNSTLKYSALSYTWAKDASYRRRIFHGIVLATILTVLSLPSAVMAFLKKTIQSQRTPSSGTPAVESPTNATKSLGSQISGLYNTVCSNMSDYAIKFFKTRDERREKEQHLVICNGSRLYVATNLHDAMLEILQRSETRWWIDAICINQEDTAERESQVDMMGNIYENAEAVIVWLGKATSFTDEGPEFMKSLPCWHAEDGEDENLRREKFKIDLSSEANRIPASMSKWFAIMLILRKHWFRRIWVMQEMMLSKRLTFYLGNNKFTPETLVNALDWWMYFWDNHIFLKTIQRYNNWFWPPDATIRLIRALETRVGFREGFRWQLEDYVDICRGREATKLNDMVFAGTSLLATTDHSGGAVTLVKTNYSKPVKEVYQEFTETMLQGMGIEVLSLAQDVTGYSSVAGLPSWVIDLSLPVTPLPLCTIAGTKLTESLSLRTLRPAFRADNNTLQVHATSFDSITDVSEDVYNINLIISNMSDKHEDFGSSLQILSSMPKLYTPTVQSIEVFWRTLIADTAYGISPAPPELMKSFIYWYLNILWTRMIYTNLHPEMNHFELLNISQGVPITIPRGNPKDLEEVVRNITKTHSSDEYPLSQILITEFDDGQEELNRTYLYNSGALFRKALKANSQNRRLFLTQGKRLGLGPSSVREKDEVMLLEGAHVPYILTRRNKEGEILHGEHRRLLGDAYVHGIMPVSGVDLRTEVIDIV